MFTIKKLNNHIDNFLLELKYRCYHVTKAILFGSYANGNVHENIDIDIAICSNEFYENTDNTQNIASIVSKFDPIQIKLYHTFENSSPFIEVINKTGRKIQLN